jgi:anti-sigma B factor antagonist
LAKQENNRGMSRMDIDIRAHEKWTILDITGNIRRKDAEQLKELFAQYIKESKLQVAINFDNIDFIDSVGLGALIYCNNKIKVCGGEIALINVNENIYDLLEMTSVDKLFKIVDSESELN